MVGACVAIARLSDPIASFPALMAWCAVATAGWLLAWRAARSAPDAPARLGAVLGVALAARLLLVLPQAPLSDDLYRYLWEGRVGNAGTNPYLHPPDADALRPLRDAVVWPRINHPSLPTLYPPVAQWYFRALAAAGPRPRAPRFAAALLDAATTAALAALLRRRGRPGALALVYGWSPLAILESGGGGHVDALGVALLVAGLWALASSSRRGALGGGLLLAGSALVKPAALLLAPALLGPRAARRGWILAGAALGLLVCVPYLGAGARLFEGFRTYAENWHFNDALFSRLVAAGASPHDARRALGIVLAAVAWVAPRRIRDPLAASGVVIGAFLALSPTAHPWYAMWLLPLLPFLPRALVPAGALLCMLLPLSYVTPWERVATGVWREPGWPRAVIWGAVELALGWALARALVLGSAARASLNAAGRASGGPA